MVMPPCCFYPQTAPPPSSKSSSNDQGDTSDPHPRQKIYEDEKKFYNEYLETTSISVGNPAKRALALDNMLGKIILDITRILNMLKEDPDYENLFQLVKNANIPIFVDPLPGDAPIGFETTRTVLYVAISILYPSKELSRH